MRDLPGVLSLTLAVSLVKVPHQSLWPARDYAYFCPAPCNLSFPSDKFHPSFFMSLGCHDILGQSCCAFCCSPQASLGSQTNMCPPPSARLALNRTQAQVTQPAPTRSNMSLLQPSHGCFSLGNFSMQRQRTIS